MKSKIYFGLIAIIASIVFTSFNSTEEWQLHKHFKGLSFYYKTADCDDKANGLFQDFIILKIVNNSNVDLEVKFKKSVWYGGECTNCDSDSEEHYVTIKIKAGEEIIGNCKSGDLSIFKEFKDKPDVAKLSNFEISDISVKQKIN